MKKSQAEEICSQSTRYLKKLTEKVPNAIFVTPWQKGAKKKPQFTDVFSVAKDFTELVLCFKICRKLWKCIDYFFAQSFKIVIGLESQAQSKASKIMLVYLEKCSFICSRQKSIIHSLLSLISWSVSVGLGLLLSYSIAYTWINSNYISHFYKSVLSGTLNFSCIYLQRLPVVLYAGLPHTWGLPQIIFHCSTQFNLMVFFQKPHKSWFHCPLYPFFSWLSVESAPQLVQHSI